MEPNAIATLVSNFLSGFVMTWLRGFKWWGEGITYVIAIVGGALITGLTGAHDPQTWVVNTMTYTLVVLGSVKVGGDIARGRAENTSIPAGLMPQFSELSDKK